MKKIALLLMIAASAVTAVAATDEGVSALLFTLTNGNTPQEDAGQNANVIAIDLNATDSIGFSADSTLFVFYHNNEKTTLAVNDVESMTYSKDMPKNLTVTYADAKATVVNPYYLDGVSSTIDGAYVTINNTDTTTERTVVLTGSTTDGGFTYNGKYKTTISLDGVSITSTKGAAIDIECGKRIALEIKKGTVNTLVDCEGGKQKAALYCKGHMEIDKAGTLNVTGNSKHAISAKEYVQLKKAEGTINILGSKSDGIHCGQYFVGNGYTVNISNIAGDGIQAEAETLDAGETWEEDYLNGSMLIQGGTYNISVSADDCDALKADTTITINSAKQTTSLTLTTTGAADKGIKSKGSINISESTIQITQSGSKIIASDDVSYATAIKATDDVNITAGTITIENTADGGKGVSADGNINISGDATVLNITANGTGGTYELDGTEQAEQTEQTVSYKMYFAKPASASQGFGPNQGSQGWSNLYLYKGTSQNSGTLVATLTTTETVNGTTYYTYDFSSDYSSTYYLKSDNVTSRGTTYQVATNTFTVADGGYYLTISGSYNTNTISGYRIYSYSTASSATAGADLEESGETYNAICIKADNKLTIDGGTLTLINNGDMSKSMKADYVVINGGDITSTIKGSLYVNGADASYCSSVKCDYFTGNGGKVTFNASNGYACRGISADYDITINGGTYNITNSCNGYVSSVDHYTAKALKCDNTINLIGGDITITMTGTGGKGIKAGTNATGTTFVMGDSNSKTGPSLTVTTTGSALATGTSSSSQQGGFGGMQQSSGADSKAIKSMGTVNIYGGQLLVSTSTDGAEGLESKTGINIYGGNHYFKCYDDCINSAGIIDFKGGNTVCYSYNNDAVDSNYGRSGAITISGGNVFSYTTKGSPEEGLDCDNNSYITITGGIAVSAGAAQGGGGSSSGSQSVGSSSQGYYLGSSPSSYSAGTYYTLCNTSGTPICTYVFDGNCSNSLSLLTAPNLGKGSITVKSGSKKPTAYDSSVSNLSGSEVFFINPTVETTGTAATLTAK